MKFRDLKEGDYYRPANSQPWVACQKTEPRKAHVISGFVNSVEIIPSSGYQWCENDEESVILLSEPTELQKRIGGVMERIQGLLWGNEG